jgi:hypothetical protein
MIAQSWSWREPRRYITPLNLAITKKLGRFQVSKRASHHFQHASDPAWSFAPTLGQGMMFMEDKKPLAFLRHSFEVWGYEI